MIKLIKAEIENFRSIIGSPMTMDLEQLTVIVGPNNCGKSNILRALELFFKGTADGRPYSPELDFPKLATLPASAQTKITLTVTYEPDKEVNLRKALEDIEKNTNQMRLQDNEIQIRLSYSKNGVESWQFIGQKGTKNIQKELIYKVRDHLRQAVIFKYIPVGRDSLESITSEISSELIKTIFSGWSGAVKRRQEINEVIKALLSKLTPELKSSSNSVTTSIRNVFPEVGQFDLKLPFANLEEMLPSLTPVIFDTAETGLKSKGAGIQTSSLLFLLKYLADNHPQRHNSRQTFIWAIEEPESFLHPSKQRAMAEMMFEFSKEVQTLITSHCAHFVPRTNSGVNAFVVDKSEGSPHSTVIIGSEYELARQSLGVSLQDSMLYYLLNIVVEGPSDEILFKGAMNKLSSSLSLNPNDVKFFPSGNATSATYLYESIANFAGGDVGVVLIIDGDDAGKRAVDQLTGRRKREGSSLQSNKDFFQLPIDTENLLSDRVKRLLRDERPAQVTIHEDTSGKIVHFSFNDGHKRACAERAVFLSEPSDLSEFQSVFDRISASINA